MEDDFIVLPQIDSENSSVYAQYTILCEDRDAVQNSLRGAGIPSVSYYAVPLHLQPVFHELGYKAGDFPVTEKVSERCLSLPMNPYLKEDEVDQVCRALLG